MLFARYGKVLSPPDLWFKVHMPVQLTAAVVATVAFSAI